MLFTPVNQIRLTNIAVVRLKKGGSRFEVACYKNKVMEWRNGLEKDIDNVLQTTTVFTNVSKGIQAKKEDLVSSFGTDDAAKICLEIINKGQLQVAEKERNQQFDSMFKDIATMVSEKCINTESKRPYPVSTIEKAMKDIHFSVVTSRSTKQQALEVIKQLKNVLPIERVKMRLKIEVSSKEGKQVQEKLKSDGIVESFEDEEKGATWKFELNIDPGHFRVVESTVSEMTKGKGKVELLELSVRQNEDDVALE
eukprot:c9271_g1_i2.p1 GENE.c9271_g1_i2~~c9271_g1_i2.p1  ORF type:complete len:253 (+),score=106.01 c9271_g1_i2:48-806(+)